MSQFRNYDIDLERVKLLLDVVSACVQHGNQYPYTVTAAARELDAIERHVGEQIRKENDESRVIPEPVKQVPDAEKIAADTPVAQRLPGTSVQAALPIQAQQTSTTLPDGQQVPLHTETVEPRPEALPPAPEPDHKGLDEQRPETLADPRPQTPNPATEHPLVPAPDKTPTVAEPLAQGPSIDTPTVRR